MTRLLLRSALAVGGLLLATASASAQRSSSRSSPTPAPPPPPTTGPTIIIVGEETAPPPPADTGGRRSRSSGRSDAALQLVWDKLGGGNADTIDVNSNPRLRLLLPSMGISVPRDGILRKPRAMTAGTTSPGGSAVPPDVGPVIITTGGSYLIPEATVPGSGPTIVYLSGDSTTTASVQPAPSSSQRASSMIAPYTTGSVASASGDPDAEDEEPTPVVYRHDSLPKEVPSFWQELDQDKDAQLSLFEWRTGGKAVEDFVKYDENEDGFLLVEEYIEAAPPPPPQPTRPTYSRYRR